MNQILIYDLSRFKVRTVFKAHVAGLEEDETPASAASAATVDYIPASPYHVPKSNASYTYQFQRQFREDLGKIQSMINNYPVD